MACLKDMTAIEWLDLCYKETIVYGVEEYNQSVLEFRSDCMQVIDDKELFKIWIDGFSRYITKEQVFTTRPEAEAKLKQLKGDG